MKLVLKNYTRLAYIDTGQYEQARFRESVPFPADTICQVQVPGMPPVVCITNRSEVDSVISVLPLKLAGPSLKVHW